MVEQPSPSIDRPGDAPRRATLWREFLLALVLLVLALFALAAEAFDDPADALAASALGVAILGASSAVTFVVLLGVARARRRRSVHSRELAALGQQIAAQRATARAVLTRAPDGA